MSAIQLTIVQPPAPETVIVGAAAGAVSLAAAIAGPLPPELAGVSLFYRWYSSLFPAAKDRYSLNVVGLTDPSQAFVAPLKVGTHVITLAASDQSAETDAAQNHTRHGGVTGGSQGNSRRIIHALVANPVTPSPAGPVPLLSKAGSTLEAEAPLQWGRNIGNTNNYEPNRLSRDQSRSLSLAFYAAGRCCRAVTRRIWFRRWTNSNSTPTRLRVPDR